MRGYTLTILLTCYFLLGGRFALAEERGLIDYKFTESGTHVSAVVPFKNSVIAYGHPLSLKFNRNEKSSEDSFSSSNDFKGYALFAKARPDQQIIIAGLNYERPDFIGTLALAPDNRQNFILRQDPSSGYANKIKVLNDRAPLNLEINSKNQSILLSTGSGAYTLTVFDPNLKKIKSKRFGSGGSGDFALTQEGTYAVVGFDKEPEATVEYPMYWEFSPDLEIITELRLGEDQKSTVFSDAAMQVLSHNADLYITYGWDKSGVSKKLPDEVRLRKIRGTSGAWQDEVKLPYETLGRFFISQAGDPYFLEKTKDGLLQTKISRKSQAVSKKKYNYPSKPIECFPAPISIINVFTDTEGRDNIALSSRPVDRSVVGCVAIGTTRF